MASECTTTPVFWILDAGGVAASAGLAIASAAAVEPNDARNILIGTGIIAGVLYLASAHNGLKWWRDCRQTETTPIAAR